MQAVPTLGAKLLTSGRPTTVTIPPEGKDAQPVFLASSSDDHGPFSPYKVWGACHAKNSVLAKKSASKFETPRASLCCIACPCAADDARGFYG